ncbi:ankyrin repeat domain-containing protein [Endozoicomonas sp. SESOKO1]|uniref:ankyrin repeat domain-containing protein n=1 Tax=Endozoicomonas sp. SESOKO1 TaxID=2828742 RepID=UPI0021477FD7|nr:ankyrin repeat domain-containing protein [Endozoicomonas sp. SESOKO1]
MNTVTPEALTAFKSVITLPTMVCHHLSIQPDDAGEFNGRQLVVCKTPTTQLVRTPDCQCDRLLDNNADIQELDTLLQNRSIDIHAKEARQISQASAYGPHETVYWYSPLWVKDPNILDKLQWFLSQEGVDIDQPINHAGQTLLHKFCHASCVHRRNSLYWDQYPVHPDNVVKWLLSQGASLATTDRLGNTPLHTVCYAGATKELMVILLEAVRENPKILNAQNENGKTALIEAMCSCFSWSGSPILILRAGATIGDGDNRSEYCPLSAVVKDRKLQSEKLALLAHYGLDISKCASEASNFVSMMIPYYFDSDTEILLYWIKSGLALNGIDDDGHSLLWVCFSTFEKNKNGEEDSGWNRKLTLCNNVLKAAYKYHFPKNIDVLKGAISDTLMETWAEDVGNLLKGYPEAFYLIDNTVEMIASNLNDQNKIKLEALLAQARGEHPEEQSLLPFIYQPYNDYMHFCSDAFTDHMEAIFSAPPSDFVKVGLEPDRRSYERTECDEEVEADVEADFEDSHQNEIPQDNHSINYSDIRLYDWLFEHRQASIRRLLSSNQELHKTICKHQSELVCGLSDENKQLLERLLGETDSFNK